MATTPQRYEWTAAGMGAGQGARKWLILSRVKGRRDLTKEDIFTRGQKQEADTGTDWGGKRMLRSWIWGEARGPEEKTRVRGAWGRRGGDAAPRGDGEHSTLGLEDTWRREGGKNWRGLRLERSPDSGRANWLEERTLREVFRNSWVVQMRPGEGLDHVGVRGWGCWFTASLSRMLLDSLEAVHRVTGEQVLWSCEVLTAVPAGATVTVSTRPQGEQWLGRDEGNPELSGGKGQGWGEAWLGLGVPPTQGRRAAYGVWGHQPHSAPPAQTCLVTQAEVYRCVSFQRREVATARHPSMAWGLAWCSLTCASELPSCTTAPHQRPWRVPIRLTDLCQKCPWRKSWASLSFLVKGMVNLLNKVSIFNDYDLLQ